MEIFQIRTIKDLPVGQHLQKHVSVDFNSTYANTQPILTLQYNLTNEKLETYLRGKPDGVLSEEGIGPQIFLVSSIAKKAGERGWPDIQYIRRKAAVDGQGRPYFLHRIGVTRSKSIGSITLDTEKYLKGERRNTELAVVDYNLAQNKDDRARFIEGKFFIEETRRILKRRNN